MSQKKITKDPKTTRDTLWLVEMATMLLQNVWIELIICLVYVGEVSERPRALIYNVCGRAHDYCLYSANIHTHTQNRAAFLMHSRAMCAACAVAFVLDCTRIC